MPWRQKGNKRVYYRSVRVDGRPRTIYVGPGMIGETAAAAVQLRRVQREQLREKQQQIIAHSSSVVDLNGQLESLTRAALVAAGFYQHARWQWRRRRNVKQRRPD